MPFQPELTLRPSPADELFVKLGFAVANGLNPVSPFALPTWAADLEDDVKEINGRDRSYLLAAWYKHTFVFSGLGTLGVTGGIVDATDYLNDNAYSDDEFTQFMHTSLVNGPNFFVPSYDLGGALEWDSGAWSARGVVMRIPASEANRDLTFLGGQLGYGLTTALGPGNYRLMGFVTTKDFAGTAEDELVRHSGVLLSLDQRLGPGVGAFMRLGWQTDDALVDYTAIASGGVSLDGQSWGREGDNVGIAYAYLDGGNIGIRHSHVAEAYYRWVVTEHLALTADVQFLQDENEDAADPSGLQFALRAVIEF
jgi:porin